MAQGQDDKLAAELYDASLKAVGLERSATDASAAAAGSAGSAGSAGAAAEAGAGAEERKDEVVAVASEEKKES
jgi:hypothetical protein